MKPPVGTDTVGGSSLEHSEDLELTTPFDVAPTFFGSAGATPQTPTFFGSEGVAAIRGDEMHEGIRKQAPVLSWA